jgi:predicted lipoprotein with Yx(FWY)xxD motif
MVIVMPAAFPPDTPADVSVFYEDGKYLFRVGESKSIYVYDRDRPGESTCKGECARKFPPVIASSGSMPVGGWTLVNRADRSMQWCYRNRPVYTYANDKPGETKGDGVDGLWHKVMP